MIKKTITESEYVALVERINLTMIIFSILMGAVFVLLGIYKSNSFILTWIDFIIAIDFIYSGLKCIILYKRKLNDLLTSKEFRQHIEKMYNIIDD